jgi:ABC-type Mn2+/Zn2+ transport system ATPase subunit
MKIGKEDFRFGWEEIDITAWYRINDSWARVSMRRNKDFYEVYAHIYRKKEDVILFRTKDLKECVEWVNRVFGLNDEYVGEN